MTILVAGGAGYIGSHLVVDLLEHNYDVVVLDNLSEGHIEAVTGGIFEQVDLADYNTTLTVLKKYNISAIVNFAGSINVGESTINPAKYYHNNVVNTLNLINAAVEANVKNIVFSSTCATYGDPQYLPLDEYHPQKPVNPYGNTKLSIEFALNDYSKAYGINHLSLRYFNAAGAHKNGSIGESHNTETHLIPLVLKVATGERDHIKIFGTDYDTADGTCVRDYIHVSDLATAHRLGIEKLANGMASDAINLGTGIGYSVKEVIDTCARVTGIPIKTEVAPRRLGDPATLVASNIKAKDLLGWIPEYLSLDDIIKTAWNWEKDRKF